MSFAAHNPPPPDACTELIRQMESLRQDILDQADKGSGWLESLPPERQASAQNLLHYLALRSTDLRSVQDQLSRLGLSSLGRAESQVLPTIDRVLANLYQFSDKEPGPTAVSASQMAGDIRADLLERNTERLLGPQPRNRRVHIMVTMPAEAAEDYLMVHQLLKNGMNCMRINCSKDDISTWGRMISHLNHAKRATGRDCRVMMDLGGPKLRTGPMEPVPAVRRIRPVRTHDGRVIRPARIWLTAAEINSNDIRAADAIVRVDPTWLAKIRLDDRIRMRDTRDSKRTWRVKEITADGCWAEARKTTYIGNGVVLKLLGEETGRITEISSLPPDASVIRIRAGDVLLMTGTGEPGKPGLVDDNGEQLIPGCVSLPLPEVYRDARQGEPVFFDDGRIGGIIEKTGPDQMQIRITRTNRQEERLGSDRGVNLPDTLLGLPALSEKDLGDLQFAARHADMIGLSFVNGPEDVRLLREKLLELDSPGTGIVVKIETKRGFSNLPAILIEALKFPACGIMIARGDLAVECGFERMAELQEEILWVCESAHVPVIWATQVLENLIKRGYASRAEITDAAMGQCAEAVMLNKGAHITEAVRTLDDILRRMQGHHNKKRSMLRELQLASAFSKSGH